MNYRPEVDGLRSVAVLPVILFHGGFQLFSGGFTGVDVFYVISGFLITGIIIHDLDRGNFSITKFYERRARRILPALFFVIACCIPFAIAWMLPQQLADFGASVVAVIFFVSNILFWQQEGYFAEASELKPLLHTWSLAVEEQYYLFFPLLLALLFRFRRDRAFWIIAALAVLSLAACEWGSRTRPGANFYLSPTRMWELLAGSLCAFVLRDQKPPAGNGLLAALGLVLICAGILLFNQSTPFPSFMALVPVGGTVLVLLFAGPSTSTARLLSLAPFRGIGLISYSAYLWHQPLFAFARVFEAQEPPRWVMGGLGLVSLGLAYLSWRFVEQPFRQRGGILPTRNSVFLASAAGGSVLAAVGAYFYLSGGMLNRYPPEDRVLANIDFVQAGDYVQSRFNSLQLAPFRQNGRPNVFVIGDSYGQDFVNILAETGLLARVNLSTHHIGSSCGNVLIAGDRNAFIPAAARPGCAREKRYDDPEVAGLMRQADYIVLVSFWQPWQVERIAESLRNLSRLSDARIIVVSSKDFGSLNIRRLLALPRAERVAATASVPGDHLRLVEELRRQAGSDFIDAQSALCEQGASCRAFTPDGELISYDGHHLTRAGAVWAGRRLWSRSPLFREILDPARPAVPQSRQR